MSSQNRGLRPFQPVRFGRYTLLTPVAKGGMGAVYLARMASVEGFEKFVVIKKILPALAQEQSFVERFVDEAKILVKLQHGSIAQVLDMGVEDDEYYIAMEFVDGKDLRKVTARVREHQQPMPTALALYVTVRVLDALAYAHRKKDAEDRELNLVHRDISPQNVLVSYEGEVKVIDFGLAKSTMSLGRTSPSMVLGKFFYMSPEQARHQPVDRRSDLYAAGICLWEMLTGTNPFDSVRPGEIMRAVANPVIPPIRSVRPELPEPLEEALSRALAINPDERYASAEEMRGRLTAVMLEIDPSAGPESLAAFMRQQFANEYESERKAIATLARLSVQEQDEHTPVPSRAANAHAQAAFKATEATGHDATAAAIDGAAPESLVGRAAARRPLRPDFRGQEAARRGREPLVAPLLDAEDLPTPVGLARLDSLGEGDGPTVELPPGLVTFDDQRGPAPAPAARAPEPELELDLQRDPPTTEEPLELDTDQPEPGASSTRRLDPKKLPRAKYRKPRKSKAWLLFLILLGCAAAGGKIGLEKYGPVGPFGPFGPFGPYGPIGPVGEFGPFGPYGPYGPFGGPVAAAANPAAFEPQPLEPPEPKVETPGPQPKPDAVANPTVDPGAQPKASPDGKKPGDAKADPVIEEPDEKPERPGVRLSRRARLTQLFEDIKAKDDRLRAKYSCDKLGKAACLGGDQMRTSFKRMIGKPAQYDLLEQHLRKWSAALDSRQRDIEGLD